MGKNKVEVETVFLLQIIVDVSGSMYNKINNRFDARSRIGNAIKGCIAVAEGLKDKAVKIEILASDGSNVDEDPQYLIKAFNDPLNGKTKENIISMASRFGGGNSDDESIAAAIPRITKEERRSKLEADKVKKLTIFISDSTTQDPSTREKVDEMRNNKAKIEGLAITDEPEVAKCVRKNFGENSLVPKNITEFPSALVSIVKKYINI
jgi:hypothetical protein